MGETTVKGHAEGNKYASSVKVSQKTESISDFLKKIKSFLQESAVLRKVRKHQVNLLSAERLNKNQVS